MNVFAYIADQLVSMGLSYSHLIGIMTGLSGLFWVATAYGVTYLFEQRPFRLWLINAGYYVVLYALMGTIIGTLTG